MECVDILKMVQHMCVRYALCSGVGIDCLLLQFNFTLMLLVVWWQLSKY